MCGAPPGGAFPASPVGGGSLSAQSREQRPAVGQGSYAGNASRGKASLAYFLGTTGAGLFVCSFQSKDWLKSWIPLFWGIFLAS